MLSLTRSVSIAVFFLAFFPLSAVEQEKPSPPNFDYQIARTHEIKPHRRTVPMEGVGAGFNQLHLKLIVSALGDVVDANVEGSDDLLRYWPELRDEVLQWKFEPFELDGKAVTAEVEEYIDLVPPERLPKVHVAAPKLRRNSKVEIALARSGCFGSCPSYEVTLSADHVVFDGGVFVVAAGKHTDKVDPYEIKKLAKEFVTADFYSMDDKYVAPVTDCPAYTLSISINGRKKTLTDYVGSWVGMPSAITELEDKVDALARTGRWISGEDGLVDALRAEKFDFDSFDAQRMLKEAAERKRAGTVRELLEAGVPLEPKPAPKPADPTRAIPFDHVGWLQSASSDPESLKVLIDSDASKEDQDDKDLALVGAARAGNLDGARALIAYGADPNADLSKLIVTEGGPGMTMQGRGAGSILIDAASSGNPEMVREILSYHPDLELKDRQGKTAIFAAGDYRSGDKEGARVECVRLLAQAGANVNARDNNGNTPIHEIYLTDVEEELIKLGADVNARNDDGETPIFTTYEDKAIPLLIKNGADLSIRNNKGETALEAAHEKGPQREELLRSAMANLNRQQ